MSQVPFDDFKVKDLPKDQLHWRNAFDSRFLRYFWLNGKPRIVTITNVQELTSSNKKESKRQLLVTLAEADKPWAINVTNCGIIEAITGKENPRDWIGTKVELYQTTTRLPNGTVGPCMRVRDQLPPQNAATKKPKWRQEVSAYTDAMKQASIVEDLAAIADRLTDDHDINQEETAYLLDMLAKRKGQIEGAV